MKLKITKLLSLSFVLALAGCGGANSSSIQQSSADTSSAEASSSEISSSLESSAAESSAESSPAESSSAESSPAESSSISSNEYDDCVLATAPFYIPKASGRDFVSSKADEFEYLYRTDEPAVIYMDPIIALDFLYDAEVEIKTADGVRTYTCPNGLSMSLDPEADTILVRNYAMTNLFSDKYGSPLGLLDTPAAAKYIDDTKTVSHASKDITLDLESYYLDIIEYDGRTFMPFTVLDELTFSKNYYSPVAFNGTAFYLLDNLSGAISISYSYTTYSEEYYSGAWSKMKKPDYMIDFNYNALMFKLDHFFGFRDERFVPFSDYLEKNHSDIVEGLHSANETTYCNAVGDVMDYVIGDGHTNAGYVTSAFGEGNYSRSGRTSERSSKLSQDYYACVQKRSRSGVAVDEVRFSGETAILSFDSFMHYGAELTASNISRYATDNNDTFALFLQTMKQIEARTETTKNVIFDITCNGGGDSNALIGMLGVMAREYKSISYCPLSEAYDELVYQVDTDLDGEFTEEDGYQGQYNFYILTSNYSFSCGNLFPAIAKQNGIAKIIGQQSGGGACTVAYTVTPDGLPFRMSGLCREGDFNDPSEHFDDGVPVDHELALNHFYDDAYLDEFVGSLTA
ncbi:MAG: hypothetical protein K6F32_06880 [Bacilli bacterium]|nr:hypothetical protein [Bacilli bacterium]